MPVISKAVPQFAKYMLGRREQKQKYEQQVGMELLRQQLWKRRLRDQATKEEEDRQMLIEREELAVQGDLAKQQRLQREYEADMSYKNRLLDIKKQELDITGQKARRDVLKAGKEADPRMKQLKTLLSMKQAFGGKYYPKERYTEEGELVKEYEPMGRQPQQLQHIDKLINELSADIYGMEFKPPEQPQKSQEQMYYDQLIKGGFTAKDASIMTQRRFAPKSKQPTSPKVSTKRKSMQEMSNEELFQELMK